MKRPGIMPPSKPIQGLAVPIPNRLSAAYVRAAAVKAPASIFPSSAMLMTLDRSENSPPSAASTSGVASRIVEAMSESVKMSLMGLRSQTFHGCLSSQEPPEETFSSDEKNDDALQDLHDIFCHVLRKAVDINSTVL